ncbi:SGNH/GDSL hydrolase family protein [Paenibacillus apiarius]|uniref:SGNH/GDSL hydrolase family protein n=1 Tax=Paenibacillus apiarius TaxID=46240 RepID=UPI00197DE3A0|nr:SGNH/GDSL hydrolase family protein [Paenibacillus apiarius]MBN3524881.1 SGNH/GDSL hydrolase family protein [Paenibacillus apiarius]
MSNKDKVSARPSARVMKRYILSRHKQWVTLILLLCYFAVTPLLFHSAGTKQTKATWLWDTEWMRDNPDEVVSFSQDNEVDLIFVQISTDVKEVEYRQFIRKAREAGIDVHALNGSPEWARADKQEEGAEFIRWVASFNEQAGPEERFTGIHLDVEPYLLRGWKRDQSRIVREWSHNMTRWLSEARAAGLYIAADVPFWLHRIETSEGGGSLGEWMLERFDSLAIMAYRDHSDSIYDLAIDMLAQAEKANKKILIGVELGKTDEGDFVTFHGKSVNYFEEHLQEVGRQSVDHPSYGGVAVHHLRAWYEKVNPE